MEQPETAEGTGRERARFRFALYMLWPLLALLLAHGIREPFSQLLERHSYWLSILWLIGSSCIACLLHWLAHALGHYLGGRADGWCRMRHSGDTALRLRLTNGRWRLEKPRKRPVLDGVRMLPPAKEPLRYTRYLLGGAVANLLAALVALPFYALLPSESPWAGFCWLLVSLGLVWGVFCAVPHGNELGSNEGDLVFRLRKSGEERRRWEIQLRVWQSAADGNRLSELPEEWMRLAAEGEPESDNGIWKAIGCWYLADRLEGARVYMAIYELLSTCWSLSMEVRTALFLEYSFWELLGPRRESQLALLEDEPMQVWMREWENDPFFQRFFAAYAFFRRGDAAAAEEHRRRLEAYAGTVSPSAIVEGERERMAFLWEQWMAEQKKEEQHAEEAVSGSRTDCGNPRGAGGSTGSAVV